eukprot:3446804-Ditylum_brightwellii.AAC.1
MDVRVSTDQRSLVVVFLMSPFLSRSNFAFKSSVKDLLRFKNWKEDTVGYVLKNHTKTAARIKSIAILKECATTKQFLLTQRILLPNRFSVCVDGAWMTHDKLVVDVGDNCCPKERLLDRPVLAAYNIMH